MEKKLRSIAEAEDLRGKTVLLRSSLNVPVYDGVVVDSFRLHKALETITFLREQGARVVLMGHIGRERHETLYPVYGALREHIKSLRWADGLISEDVEEQVQALRIGEVMLLENLRSHKGEMEGDDTLATDLSAYGDIYVNDAFSVSHRAHASIVGLPKLLPSYGGLQFVEEYEALSTLLKPEHPAICILGGAKPETKLPLVASFQKTYDTVFVGGVMTNDFYKASGYEIGTSLSSDVVIDPELLKKENIILPEYVLVDHDGEKVERKREDVQKEDTILDIAPRSIQALEEVIMNAKTIVWNGPLGNFEKGYTDGTYALAECVAESPAHSVVGGGDTITAIHNLESMAHFDFVSTAGGAMISFLTHGTLPGIDALIEHGA